MKQISRIEQIHYELQAIAKIHDPEEKSRILVDYRLELDKIGRIQKSMITGDVPGLSFDEWVRNTPEWSKVEREDYRTVRNEWKTLQKAVRNEARHLRAYHEPFNGAKAEFSRWFDAPSDKAVSEIFAGTFKVSDKDKRIPWKGRSVEAILFARAIDISTAYLNEIFVAPNMRKFQDSAFKPGRRKNNDKWPQPPKIVWSVAKYKKVTAPVIIEEYNTTFLEIS